MAQPFERTERALGEERARSTRLALLGAVLLLIAWGFWFTCVRVAVWEVAPVARIEVGGAAHPVQMPRAGRVARLAVALGDSVQQGDVLLELDSTEARLRRAESAARLAAAERDLVLIGAELLAMQQEQQATDRVGQMRVAETRAQASAARAEADVAANDSGLLGRLEHEGLASKADATRASGTARARLAAANAQYLGSERATRERTERSQQWFTRHAELERERGRRQSEAEVLRREVDKLDWEIGEHTVRASIAGKVGEVSPLRAGSVVAAGDKVLTLVPNGELKVVAGYTRDVVGRIRSGQTGRVRLSSFSWMQYGTLSARVTRVGTEPLNGLVQVELRLTGADPRRIPLQHGLVGNVDIEVERATPAELVLRTIGHAVSGDPPLGRPQDGK